MISAPDAAMLDQKFFVSRFDDPFPDLYERWWDGVEWVWVNHGRPGGSRMATAPGAAMLDQKLFVATESGNLWERHWRSDARAWAWEDHGRPGNQRIVHAPGAAMANEKLFVVTDTGNLWERHWRSDQNRWAWEDHGRPGNQRIVHAPGAAMANEKLFVVTDTGNLWERHWRSDLNRWAWEDHGRPGNQRIVHAPGAAMANEKLFVVTDTGNLWERHWRSDLNRWAWEDHGRPGNQRIVHAPGAAMANDKLFVVTDQGQLWERDWRPDLNRWAWQDHGRPPGTQAGTAPGAAILGAKLFVGASNSHLFERVWTGEQWSWVDHGTAFHDQSAHVIGAPGGGPALTVVVMGDGFDEGDMPAFRQIVADNVVRAFGLDVLAAHQDRLKLIRIDVVSPVSGVTERRYDEHGTVDKTDDTLDSENFRFSRLGFIGTGIWSHCWIETSDRTRPRIDSIRRRFAPEASNIIVLVNSSTQGGCNRGNLAAFTRGESAEVIAHEMGHNMFGLGDEYNNDTRTWTGPRDEPNLTEQPTAWTGLKWRDLVDVGAALPTDPAALPPGWNPRTSVGAFEGGGGNFSTGIFRPVLECRMNQNNPPWCPVCTREIDRIFGGL